MVTFRNNNNNNRRNNFRRNDRNFKSNGDRPKYGSNFSNNENFQRKVPGRNNHNAPKLIEKYENLAREALSSGDKILSENYFQHADHFTRILNEQEAYKKARYASTNEINKELPEDNVTEEEVIVEEPKSKVVSKKEEPETKVAAAK
ncbi:DUF4167 domain-containing protein [Candidatus Pelagibacter sp.]|jgi:hypothetical protein|nr:DUF4167 domain-containing protein [Candidatus Pelagibacter sp.]